MGAIRRKWNIQKAGRYINGIDAYAMYFILGAILFIYGMFGIVAMIVGSEWFQYSYTVILYANAMALWIGCPGYSLFKKMGRRKSRKLAQNKKGAVDAMYIASILPVEKREVKNANFYRWILGSVIMFLGIVYLVLIGTKIGIEVNKYKFFEEVIVVHLLLYLFCYTTYWIHMVLEQKWSFVVSMVAFMISYLLVINGLVMDKIISLLGGWFRLPLFLGNKVMHEGQTIFFLDPVIGNSIVVISLVWLIGLGILFFFFNRNNQSWMRRGEYE